ncbi:MAG: 2Fe-2S iron-sulfur cluster-binding protein [Pedobacter sp.]|jgi:2Fe-2S ferredoxin
MSLKICLTVLYGSEEYLIQTFHGEYRDLKCLIADRLFTENFGECGGVGRCGTCMVEIEGLNGEAAALKRNESTTLGRLMHDRQNIRLACQIPVDDSLSNLVIKVIEN